MLEASIEQHEDNHHNADTLIAGPWAEIGTRPVDTPEVTQPVVQETAKEEVFALKILALNWRCLRHPEAGGVGSEPFRASWLLG